MNVSSALEFVFEDEEWVGKLLLSAVILLIPLLGPLALSGYVIALIRNVMAGKEKPLPHWEEPGRFLSDGLMYCLVSLLYSLPLLMLACPVLLSWVLPLLGGEDREAAWALVGLSSVVTAALGCLAGLYAAFLMLLASVLQIRYAHSGTVRACLRLGAAMRFLLAHFGRILLITLLLVLAALVVTLIFGGVFAVLAFVPLCGPVVAALGALLLVPVYVWLGLFSGHLYGQVGREAGLTAFPG
jgi:hypothetical protein